MWKNGKPSKDGWYLTRRTIAGSYIYNVFFWSSKTEDWKYLEPLLWVNEKVYDSATEYVEAWTEIPE